MKGKMTGNLSRRHLKLDHEHMWVLRKDNGVVCKSNANDIASGEEQNMC